MEDGQGTFTTDDYRDRIEMLKMSTSTCQTIDKSGSVERAAFHGFLDRRDKYRCILKFLKNSYQHAFFPSPASRVYRQISLFASRREAFKQLPAELLSPIKGPLQLGVTTWRFVKEEMSPEEAATCCVTVKREVIFFLFPPRNTLVSSRGGG